MRLINDILLDPDQIQAIEHNQQHQQQQNFPNASNASSYNEEFDNDTMEQPNSFFSLLQLMYLSYMPVCCIVGFTGNCMVWILIRSNRIFRKLPSSIYLLTLAVMSSIFLLSLVSFWVEEGFTNDAGKHSMIICKCATFLAHFCDFSSVWLIVLVAFERLTLLYRTRYRRSVTNAKAHVFVLLLVGTICNSWILIVAEINDHGTCDIKTEYEYLYNAFSIAETIICMILPTFIIISSNALVVIKLKAHLNQLPTSPKVSFDTADVVYTTGISQTIKSIKVVSKASLCRLNSRPSLGKQELLDVKERIKRHSLRYADLQLTRSLLIVTSVFILLNLPNYLYRIGIQFLNISDQSEVMQRLSLAAHVLLYTHHAILFYLYIFYSPQMKKRLWPTALKLLECYCLKPVHELSDNGINY